MLKRETLFLKLAIIIIVLPILVLGIFGLYLLADNPVKPQYASILYPIIIGLYVSAIPFYIALYKAFKLIEFIDKNIAFSELSIRALKTIKYCAITISTLYVIIFPFVTIAVELDDAPGLIIVGFMPIFVSIIIAVFAAVLQKLLKNVIEIKAENDLTV